MKKVVPFLTIISVCIFPVIFLYATNANEIAVTRTLSSLLLFLVIGLVLFSIMLIISRSLEKAAITASILSLLIFNFSFIVTFVQPKLPNLRFWHIAFIFIGIACALCAFIIIKVSNEGLQNICKLVSIAFGALIVINVITAVPHEIERIKINSQAAQVKLEQALQEINNKTGKRNIYYILCDEYASDYQLKNYFNFDNSSFTQMLESKGFNVSQNSRNESSSTMQVITNFMCLEYAVNYDMKSSLFRGIRENNPYLIRLLREQGYTLNSIGNTWEFNWPENEGEVKKEAINTTIEGDSFYDILVNRTMLSIFLKKDPNNAGKLMLADFDKLINIDIAPSSSTFTFAYFCAPHVPFYFDKNGNYISEINQRNYADFKYYTEYLQFTNSKLEKAVSNILSKDPNSIIVLGSDHGNRYSIENTPYEIRQRIYNAVYYANEPFEEIKDLSTVNTFRKIFSKEFDINLPILEVPYELQN